MKKCWMLWVIALSMQCGATFAQEIEKLATPKDAILILDASGSMWGQIDGVNKIVIAKDVVEGLVRNLPTEQRLGFVAYGHRKEGDCNDIQTLADVGAERGVVISELRGLSPKGKTPLTKSVEHAATALDYTKNAATVILVSDGLETCEADPCALAKTLEENGLDFTVHVVGFDVTEEERTGLQCIADETGGQFMAADNANELTDALSQVAATNTPLEEAPEQSTPVPSQVVLKATILSGGPQIMSKLDWSIYPVAGGEVIFSAVDTGSMETEIAPGDYKVKATWKGWRDGSEKKGSLDVTINAQNTHVFTVPIDLALPVELDAPAETPEGQAIDITWTGPDDLGAAISVNRLDDAPSKKIYFFVPATARAKSADTLKDTDGDGDKDQDDRATWQLGAPTVPGEYEVRYTLGDPNIILARQPLTVTDSAYTVSSLSTAPVATEIDIAWTGPLTPGDMVTIVPKGDERAFDNGRYRALKEGEQASLTTPKEPGDYEIRYVMSGGYTTYAGMLHAVQTSVPLKVTDVAASLVAPATAVGGSTIEIAWTGPTDGWENDFISIIARTPITVTRAEASVEAPDTVRVGEDFEVAYSGDAFKGDRIIVAPAETPDIKMWGWTPAYGFVARQGETTGTVRGSKAIPKPGVYEVRYVTGLQHQVLARDTITVTE